LTEIRLPDYSAGMIAEFATLLEKTRQLAALSHAVRTENAALRATVVALTAEKADLSARIHEAHTRVALLLAAMPAAEDHEEESA